MGSPLKVFHAALVAQFIGGLFSGIVLSLFYRSAEPYETDRLLHDSWMRWVQGFHYWQSSLLILESLVLITILVWNGDTAKAARPAFLSSLLIFLASMGFQITGNALPFDRHGVGTAAIEASIGARVPVLGTALNQLALGGTQFSPRTVEIWYRIHLGLTLAAVAALFLAFSEGKNYRKQFTIRLIGLSVLPALALAVVVASPLGSKATSTDYNSFSDRASWYTQPLHGALVMCSRLNASLGWVGAVLIPTGLGLLIFSLPWLKPRVAKSVGRIGVGFAALFFGIASVGFGGAIDPLTGTRDPAAQLVSQGKSAPIDRTLAAKGRQLFKTSGCSNCHGIDGLKGTAGPTLANVQTRHPDADYFVKYIKNPQSMDANSTMPAFPDLAPAQLQALAEYVRMPNKPG
jgi:cytochrome c551/c552/quinol-cytochrome oxidoreductase complex cytochrome b subunit